MAGCDFWEEFTTDGFYLAELGNYRKMFSNAYAAEVSNEAVVLQDQYHCENLEKDRELGLSYAVVLT